MNEELLKSMFERSDNLLYTGRYVRFLEQYKHDGSKGAWHHILPRSLFPEYQDTDGNVIYLSHRAHFIAHKMLAKIFDCPQMHQALWWMMNINSTIKVTASQYELYRSRFVKNVSDRQKKRLSEGTHHWSGDQNPNFTRVSNGTHHFLDVSPWHHWKSHEGSKIVWWLADEIVDFHKENKIDVMKYRDGRQKTWRFIQDRCREYSVELSGWSLKNMYKKFKSGWNPTEDPDWIKFKSEWSIK
ncbi:Seg-like homing endonuclease protein [Rhizobium phage RHph_TM61]|nr:Seg-like homing endonuclease protein [Rhizobium phage RHph_TM61]